MKTLTHGILILSFILGPVTQVQAQMACSSIHSDGSVGANLNSSAVSDTEATKNANPDPGSKPRDDEAGSNRNTTFDDVFGTNLSGRQLNQKGNNSTGNGNSNTGNLNSNNRLGNNTFGNRRNQNFDDRNSRPLTGNNRPTNSDDNQDRWDLNYDPADTLKAIEALNWNPQFDPVALLNSREVFADINKEAKKMMANMNPKELAELQKGAQELSDLMYKLRTRSAKFRAWTYNYEPASVFKARQNLHELKIQLELGKVGPAVEIYQTLFHDVENSYLELKRDLEALKKMSPNSDHAVETQKRIDANFKTYGKGFEEYLSVRLFLEGLVQGHSPQQIEPALMFNLSEKSTVPEVAFEVLSRLGIPGEHRDNPFISKPNKRIKADEMLKFYQLRTEPRIIKLKQDMRDELKIFGLAFIFGNPAIKFLRSLNAKMPQRAGGKHLQVILNNILDVFGEVYLRHLYFAKIDQVISRKSNRALQLQLMMDNNNQSENPNEFLITFARLSPLAPEWVEIKAFAENMAVTTNNLMYKNFVEKMDMAEKEAIKFGTFSPGKVAFNAKFTRVNLYLGIGALLYWKWDWVMVVLGIGEKATKAAFPGLF